jgi:hypothetical protein
MPAESISRHKIRSLEIRCGINFLCTLSSVWYYHYGDFISFSNLLDRLVAVSKLCCLFILVNVPYYYFFTY